MPFSLNFFYFFYLLCHIYPGVPHQCAALFSLGLLHYMHDKTNINQHTFSYNTVTTLTTWYIHHYMHNVNYVYMFLITVVTCRCYQRLRWSPKSAYSTNQKQLAELTNNIDASSPSVYYNTIVRQQINSL